MLRGRGSCTISERPTPSSTPKSPLSLIIPVDPGYPPVSSIIPVHTQKQGGGVSHSARSEMTHLHLLPFVYLQLRYKMSARRHFVSGQPQMEGPSKSKEKRHSAGLKPSIYTRQERARRLFVAEGFDGVE